MINCRKHFFPSAIVIFLFDFFSYIFLCFNKYNDRKKVNKLLGREQTLTSQIYDITRLDRVRTEHQKVSY